MTQSVAGMTELTKCRNGCLWERIIFNIKRKLVHGIYFWVAWNERTKPVEWEGVT